jgi:putative peptide modification system cyclase
MPALARLQRHPVLRHPAALAAELLLVAGLVGGAWFLTRPQPAIAFNERDWVVVGDLRNLTGDTLLDDSLEQAFRISLEQSRYVNVLSDLKARDTLGRMRRKPGTVLDRAVASEIALRDGARAVILPTVAEIGGRVRVSAEVIDPHTQTTVYAASADGSGAGSTLGSIDKVTSELRGKLGEALESIQKNSVSLPLVTTDNLDALKAYAIGRGYVASGELLRARSFLERAVKLDASFGLGWVALGGLHAHGLNDFASASRYYARAEAVRDRLPPRDALKLDAAIARLGPPGPAIEKLDQVVELYPDELNAQLDLAQLYLWDLNDAELALRHAKAASAPQAERVGAAHYMQGIALLALERPADAIHEFERSRTLGFEGAGYSHADAYAVQRNWSAVDRVLGENRVETAFDRVQAAQQEALFAADRRHWDEALSKAALATRIARDADPVVTAVEARIGELAIQVAAARAPKPELASLIRRELANLDDNAAKIDAQLPRLRISAIQALGVLAARVDDARLATECMRRVDAMPAAAGYPAAEQVQAVLAAELERIARSPGAATTRLRDLAGSDAALALVHSTLWRSDVATEDRREADAQARWLASHRGRAYVERPADGMLTVLGVIDSAPVQPLTLP